MTHATLPRTRHVEHCMGTVFTIDIRDPGDWAEPIDEAVRWLHLVDAVFSTYRAGSDISRIRRGELRVADAHPSVSEVLDLCADVHRRTRGCFSPLVDGRVDPTGLVKGWAIERASQLLRTAGSAHHAVNGGGDIQLSGEAAPGQLWRIGITDPLDASQLVATVAGRDIAIATSGVAERGAHIVDPFTGRPALDLASVTVVGPSLATVDAYATAAFVMGTSALSWVESLPRHEALVIAADGSRTTTAGWPGID